MTEPQLIFLHQGAFRKGRLVPYTESRYIGFDIKGNCLLEPEEISPFTLHLVCATSLSPRLLKETQPEIKDEYLINFKKESHIRDVDFQREAFNIGEVVRGIVDEAKHVAVDSGVPYFSVAAVSAGTAPRDMDQPISERNDNSLEEYMKNVIKPRPARVVQYTLHPTVQLYLPR